MGLGGGGTAVRTRPDIPFTIASVWCDKEFVGVGGIVG